MPGKCIVLGGNGFIGSHLIKALVNEGHSVTNVDIDSVSVNDAHNYLSVNSTPISIFEREISHSDWIFHLAGVSDITAAEEMGADVLSANLAPTASVIKSIAKRRTKRVIFASSMYAAGPQLSYYALSKNFCEQALIYGCKKAGVSHSICRIGSVYGRGAPENNRIALMLANVSSKQKLTINGPHTQRGYVYIDDVVDALISQMAQSENKYLNIRNPNEVTDSQLVDLLREIMGAPAVDVSISRMLPENRFAKTPYRVDQIRFEDIAVKTSLDQGLFDTLNL